MASSAPSDLRTRVSSDNKINSLMRSFYALNTGVRYHVPHAWRAEMHTKQRGRRGEAQGDKGWAPHCILILKHAGSWGSLREGMNAQFRQPENSIGVF